jgi:putative acetyltransferase
MEAVDIRRSTLTSPDVVRLIAKLNAELEATFPEPGATHFSLIGAQVEAGDGVLVIAYLDDVAVGCGAVRRLDGTTAELKRMYVAPCVRGRGIGRALVEALEREARLLGVTKVVLETGTRLAPANCTRRSGTLAGEEVDEGLWDVCFGPPRLGRMNEHILRIEDIRAGPSGKVCHRVPLD